MAAKKAGTTNSAGGGKRVSNASALKVAVTQDPAKHHLKPQYAGAPAPRSVQQPRISTTIPPSGQSAFADPRSAGLHGPFHSPHLSSTGQAPQHSPYAPSHDSNYYASHPSPHSAASASGHYPLAEGADQMATTAHMHRPYPPIYHNPQASSPASVASPQTHDPHARNFYGQAPAQVSQPIYGYQPYSSVGHVHPSHYSPHSAQPPPHPMAHAPMMQPPSSNAPMQQPQMGQSGGITNSSPRLRMDPMSQQPPHPHHPQPQHQTPPQHHQHQPQHQQPHPHPHPQQQQPPPQQSSAHQPMARMIQQHNPTQPPSVAAHNPGLGPSHPSNINPSAAPGPIPATTPLVVRQDNNGTQWIAFEYSRDRVKSEYTIRCDVESVNVDSLSADFKNENCVYPRACCGKDGYKGNRLNYETECNAVGWALAELNTCLRGKRGLIQRAVDSWRNSNQDPRLRSRRVRRQAKVHQRNKTQHAAQIVGGPSSANLGPTGLSSTGLIGVSGSTSATNMRAPTSSTVSSMGAPQLQHHHHARSDVPGSGQPDSSAGSDYPSIPASSVPRPQPPHGQSISTPSDLGRDFSGYARFGPPAPSGGSPVLRSSYDSLDALSRPGGVASNIATPPSTARDQTQSLVEMASESRKPKFEEDHAQRQDDRVRLGMQFGHDGSNLSPRSYPTYHNFPRSSFPPSMPAPATAGQSRGYAPAQGDHFSLGRTETAGSSGSKFGPGYTIVPPGGEVVEEQRTGQTQWTIQDRGRSLPRLADGSPPLVERSVLPPSGVSCR